MVDAPPIRYFLHTLGCKVNQYESRALAEAFAAKGFLPAAGPEDADLIVVNTCAVTGRAEAEGRRLTRSLAGKNPAARLCVTGCAAVVSPAAFAALGALPAPDKAALARDPFARPPDKRPAAYPGLAVAGHDRARALLKVQDGCSHGCAFCIVPRARGPSVSRPLAEAVAEARRLLAAGHRELVVSGVNLGHWGRDLPGAPDLWDLLAGLEAALAGEWAGRARLRLTSLDPAVLDAKGLATLAASTMVCPHLHVSLQSADPGVLAAMGRGHCDPAALADFFDALAGIWPVFGLGFDVLTAFPGETEAAFAATRDFLAASPLTYAHVFPYSRRPGTRAATMPGQVGSREASRRAAALRAVAKDKKVRFLHRLAALPSVTAAVERTNPATGTSQFYADCRFDAAPAAPIGALVPARPLAVAGEVLVVAPLPGPEAAK